jgi:pyruvate/2-oxoacid:ferredoxin oxidoreductase beta subunit
MIRFLFKLGLSLVVLLLVYNYFLGTPEEKSTSKKIFHLGKSSWDLLRAEKQKLKDGKYDLAMDKVSQLLNGLENAVVKRGDPQLNEQFQDLTNKRDQLLQMEEVATGLTSSETNGTLTAQEKSERLKLLKALLAETEVLMNQLENR